MATKQWYLVNNVDANGWQTISESTQSATTTVVGWVVGTGTTNHSELQANAERASTTFTGTTAPDGTLDTTLKDAFRILAPVIGTFASGNWTFRFGVVGTVQSGAADGQIVFRMIKANADGSSATEITSAQQSASVVTNVTSTELQSTLTFNPGAFTLTAGQYLFIQVAWKRTGAGGMTTTNVRLRTGSTTTVGTSVLSSDFTPGDQAVTGVFIAATSHTMREEEIWLDLPPKFTGGSFTAAGMNGGQSFTAAVTALSKVDLYLNKVASPTDNVYIELRATTFNGTLLGTSDLVACASLSATSGWVTFTFPSTISLTISAVYYIQVYLTRGALDSTNFLAWRAYAGTYSGGTSLDSTGGAVPSADMALRLWWPDQHTIVAPPVGADQGVTTQPIASVIAVQAPTIAFTVVGATIASTVVMYVPTVAWVQVLWDTFVGGGGDPLYPAHIPDQGNTWVNVSPAPTFGIEADGVGLIIPSASLSYAIAKNLTPLNPDQAIEFGTSQPAGKEVAGFLRMNHVTDDYTLTGYILFRATDGQIQIQRQDTGGLSNYVVLANTAAGATSAGDTLRLEIVGSNLRALKNGVQVLTASDATYPSGYAGIMAWNNNTANLKFYDEVRAFSYGEVIPVVTLPTIASTTVVRVPTVTAVGAPISITGGTIGGAGAVTASDNFTRADAGSLGSNWTEIVNGLKIVSNRATVVNWGGAFQSAYWNATTFGPKQFSELLVAPSLSSSGGYQAFVMAWMTNTAGTVNAYIGYFGAAYGGTLNIGRLIGSSPALLQSTGVAVAVGDVVRIEVEDSGTDAIVRVYVNGVQAGTTVTEFAPFSPGQPGIGGSYTDYDVFESWSGGELGVSGGGGASLFAPAVSQLLTGPIWESTAFGPAFIEAEAEISAPTIASTGTLGAPTVAPGPVTVTTGTRTTTIAVTQPTVAPGAVTITAGTRVTTTAVFAPSAIALLSGATIGSGSGAFPPSTALNITTGTRSTTVQVNAPTIVPGPASVTGAYRPSTVQMFAASIAVGAVSIETAARPTTAQLFAMAITVGAVAITGSTVAAAGARYAPTVVPQAVAITTGTVTTAIAVTPPALAVGVVTITGGTRTSTIQVNAPLIASQTTGATIGSVSGCFPFSVALTVTLPTIYPLYGRTVIADGAIHYWRLGEASGITAVDSVSGVNGTISGGVTLGAAGAISDGNPAMMFDGATGYISISHAPFLDIGTASTTWEMWLRPTALPTSSNYRIVFDVANVIEGTVFNCYMYDYGTGPTLQLDLVTDGGTYYAVAFGPESLLPFVVGDWYHLAIVLDRTAGTFQMFVNGVGGVAEAVPSELNYVPGPASTLEIGRQGYVYAASLNWSGQIDDIAIYPSALTSGQVANHLAVAAGGVFAPMVVLPAVQTITPPAIAATSAVFVPTLTPGPVAVTTAFIGATSQVFLPTVVRPAVQTIFTPLIGSTSGLGVWVVSPGHVGMGTGSFGTLEFAGVNYSQTISGHAGVLTSVDIQLRAGNGLPTDAIYLEIRESTFTGTLLATSQSVPLSTVVGDEPQWFNFAILLTLNAGTTYWIRTMLTRASDDVTKTVLVGISNGNVYSGGEAKNRLGNPSGAGLDLGFRLLSPTHAIAVGPATVLLPVWGTSTILYPPSALPMGALGGPHAASALNLFSPTVTPGVITVGGPTRPSAISCNPPSLTTLTFVTGAYRPTTVQMFAPTVVPGAITIVGPTRSTTANVHPPSVAPGPVTILSAHKASTATLYPPSLATGPVGVTTAYRPTTVQVFAPSVAQLVAGTVVGATIGSTTQVFVPSLQWTAIVVTPARLTTIQVFAPSVALFISGITVPSTAQVYPPRLSAVVTLPFISPVSVVRPPSLSAQVTTGTIGTVVQLFAPSLVPLAGIVGGTVAPTAQIYPPLVRPGLETGLIVSTVVLFPPKVEPEVGDIVVGGIGPGSVLFPPSIARILPPSTCLASGIGVRYLVASATIGSVVAAESTRVQVKVMVPPPMSVYQQRILDDAAVAYWPLNDSVGSTKARDLVGQRTGVFTGAVTSGHPGIGGATSALIDSLTVEYSYIWVPSLPVLRPQFSYELWSRSLDFIQRGLFGRSSENVGDVPGPGALAMWKNQSQYSSISVRAEDKWNAMNGGIITLLEWTHIVVTHDGVTCRIFLNGVQTGIATIPLPVTDVVADGVIGGYFPMAYGQFQDVAVYTRALTHQEVADHYNLRFSGGGPVPPKTEMTYDIKTRTLVTSDGLHVCCLEKVHD